MKLQLILIGIVLFVINLQAQSTTGIEIDSRAYNYYSAQEVAEMPDIKIAKINYLINNSFIIPNEMKGRFTKKDVNGFEFSSFRKENERAKVPLLVNEEVQSKEYIILLSTKEVEDAYLLIDKKYQK